MLHHDPAARSGAALIEGFPYRLRARGGPYKYEGSWPFLHDLNADLHAHSTVPTEP